MSDEDCLFGKYLDAGYWNELFENEDLDGVQKHLETLQELPEKNETIEQPMDVRMPSAASLEGWVSDGLSYENYVDDFVSQKLDEVFDEVRNDYPNVDVGSVRAALANYYHENSESAWHDNSIAADDAIMFVEDELDDMED